MTCVFNYEFKDLNIEPVKPRISENENNQNENNDNTNPQPETCCGENFPSAQRFDLTLCKLWDDAQAEGLFRYQFKKVPSKVLPGQYGFFAQLNPDRAAKRREPEMIQSLCQPFNGSQFNFHKVRPQEILLQVKPWWSTRTSSGSAIKTAEMSNNTSSASLSHDQLLSDESDHKILINVSPFEYGNILLVPFINDNYPQLITRQGLKLALELILLSRSRDFRVGFNSLCAYASVNHCHFHAYYLQHRLYLESVELKHLSGSCLEICNYPAPGFAFALTNLKDEETFESFISQVFKLISFCQLNNHPYNLYIMRGSAPKSSVGSASAAEAIRVFLWARSPSFGHKICDAFNPALCELAGHFPIKNETAYENLDESYAAEELKSITVDVFTKIRDQVAALYSNN